MRIPQPGQELTAVLRQKALLRTGLIADSGASWVANMGSATPDLSSSVSATTDSEDVRKKKYLAWGLGMRVIVYLC
jgi:hypothetical protein